MGDFLLGEPDDCILTIHLGRSLLDGLLLRAESLQAKETQGDEDRHPQI